MARIDRFEDLDIWILAKDIANRIYDLTSLDEFSKDFALKDQVRRAAISVFSNIAEGFERNGNKEFLQFLSIAKASCGEVRAQMIFACDRNYISAEKLEEITNALESLSRQMGGFSKYLRQSELKGQKFS